MNALFYRKWIFLLVLSFLFSCHTARKSYLSGDFETSIQKAVNKLRHDRTDEESIVYLEAAHAKLNAQTTERISFLRKEGRPENVLPVYDEMSKLKLYDDMIKPLLPLNIPSKHRAAQFHFLPDEDFINAKQSAAEYLYAHANQLLSTNNRMDARGAYSDLEELKCIYPSYKDADQKMQEALNKGTNQVNLKIVNNSYTPLFAELEKQMTTISIGDLNAPWVNFSSEKNSNRHFDYNLTVNVQQILVTPDLQLQPNVYTEKKSVQDGWQYTYDAKGNVKKDSLGNDIKRPKYKTISCIVTEYTEQKSSTITGTIDFYRLGNNSLLYSYPFDVHEIFEHRWATANGDLKALTQASADKIKIGPAPYPNEIDMLLKVSDDLKGVVKDQVRNKIELVRY